MASDTDMAGSLSGLMYSIVDMLYNCCPFFHLHVSRDSHILELC